MKQMHNFAQLQTFHQHWPWATFSSQVFIYASDTAESLMMQHWPPDRCDLASTLKRVGTKTIATTLSRLVNSGVKPGPAGNTTRKTCVLTGKWHMIETFPQQVTCRYTPECSEVCLVCIKQRHGSTMTENNTEERQHVDNRASQALKHLTPLNEHKKFGGSAEMRSGQRRQHKSFMPCYNFRLLRLTLSYYPWTPRHRLIIIPYNLLYRWLCRVHLGPTPSTTYSWRQSPLISPGEEGLKEQIW